MMVGSGNEGGELRSGKQKDDLTLQQPTEMKKRRAALLHEVDTNNLICQT